MKKFTNIVVIKFILLALAFLSLIFVRGEDINARMVLLAQSGDDVEHEVLGTQVTGPYKLPIFTGIGEFNSEAKSVIAVDYDTLDVLHEDNADEQLPMASTTKLMAAYVALKEFRPDHIIKVTKQDIDVIGSSLELEAGEKIYMSELVKGMLVRSGNDAAHTLENEFKRNGKNLISLMNMYVDLLGLRNTHFVNASGLDEEDHYSSARDLAVIAKFALKHEAVKEAVSKPSVTVTSTDGKVIHNVYSTNQLFGVVEGVVGIKTGYTENAGQCFIGSVIRGGHQIITVVLNSPDRFEETAKLTEWIFENYSWK